MRLLGIRVCVCVCLYVCVCVNAPGPNVLKDNLTMLLLRALGCVRALLRVH